MEVNVMDLAPVVGRVRVFGAPVDRVAGVPMAFDVAADGRFALSSPPAGWVDLGWVTGFKRESETKVEALGAGAPAVAAAQVVTAVGARVSMEFGDWGRLAMALASPGQTTNVLQAGVAAVPVVSGSTAMVLQMGEGAAGFAVGDLVAVDADYAGATGFVGAGWSAAYVATAPAAGAVDVAYLRSVTLNVGVVTAVSGGAVTLAEPLLAGVPTAGMQAQVVVGFGDRSAGSGFVFGQAWSAVCVMDGVQGDRVLVEYPWLEASAGASETQETLEGLLRRVKLAGEFRALPVADADGVPVVARRWYLP
jgi:hypothetical protein